MRGEERRQQDQISRLRVQLEESRKSEEEARMRVALRLAAAAKGLEEHTEEVEDAKERANQEASRGVWYWRSSGLGC